ncbi:MAG TPA: SRPBCC family protein [Noviherbaspirillum sp.]|uniref:SRPBCC family protein n=1 Tax=Noviherbaspirillum sp. TaxID=1926288 RepID=UPI002B488B88|nr:SRPBCC family protein [Noviherbaspirillum sp.]HJV86449.1 SRPBCC family protein [Noviherbaspirillum sp.]
MHAQEHPAHGEVQADAHRIQQNGEAMFAVEASAFVRASPQRAWQVLTDYERLPLFVPDLESSKLISRSHNEAIIEQHSRSGFVFFTLPVHMKLRIVEQPMARIDVTLLSGDLKHYAAHWDLEPATQDGMDGTRIHFSSTLEPNFFLPPLLGTAAVRSNVRKMVDAVSREIERGMH